MKCDVVGIGQCSVDYLSIAESYPRINEKVEITDFKIEGGGPTATAMVTLKRLGIDVSFIGKVGDDHFSDLIIEGLRTEGVDVSSVVVEEGRSSQFAFIVAEKKSGKRNIFFTRGTVTPLEFSEINTTLIDNCKILHLDGLMTQASIEAAEYAKSAGKEVSLDAGTLRAGMLDIIKHTDYLVTSEKFARSFLDGSDDFESALRELRELGPKVVCITLGENGSMALKDDAIIRQPAYKEIEIVDTTGAGDVYHGGFIYGILKGYDLKKTMNFASFASALKCRTLGGRSAIPRVGELDML